MELLENVLFSIVLNHNPPDSVNVVNSYKPELIPDEYYKRLEFEKPKDV
ncbi:MAG: hypothetical protein HOE30_08835 [Deltaproteobacteria bacterium]|nr:hypothetical protein [Deltaproteobacteria bacterium]MBT7710344.1 hypothetical protein [Deltaproteobacteria bacterium]